MIKGKIINILNHYDIIINVGKIDGVSESDKFYILDSEPTEIIDIDTKKVLDSFYRKKTKVSVKEIKEKYTICTSPTKVYGGVLQSALSGLTNDLVRNTSKMYQNGTSIQKELNIDEEDMNDIFNEYSNAKIKIGDTIQNEN